MKLKHILLIAIPLVIIIAIASMIYTTFHGNPFTVSKATKAIEAYIEETYSDNDLIVDQARYNFKFNNYWCKVHSPSSIDTHFTVEYDDAIEWDNYEWYVLSGRNTKMRFEDEYTKLITPLMTDLYGDHLTRALIMYDDDEPSSQKPSLDEPFVVNDDYPKKLMVNINHDIATPEIFAENLEKIYMTMQDQGYDVNAYTLYIEIDGRAYSVRDIQADLINDHLLDTLLSATSKDETEIGFCVDFP